MKNKKVWFSKPSSEVSNRMKSIKSKGTKLELAMEDILRKCKVNYEVQPRIDGRPDFHLSNTGILLFCDSSFWHGRRKEDFKGKAFKKNKEFWINKLSENRNRDQRTNRRLRRQGWSVHRFWDTDIYGNKEKVIRKLKRAIDCCQKRNG